MDQGPAPGAPGAAGQAAAAAAAPTPTPAEVAAQAAAEATLDLDSVLPGNAFTARTVDAFFSTVYEPTLRAEGAGACFDRCLLFGPSLLAELRELLLGPAGTQLQALPALQSFCQSHDLLSKQFLLLPLVDATHASLLVVCQLGGVLSERSAAGAAAAAPCILHLDSLSSNKLARPAGGHKPNFVALRALLQHAVAQRSKAACKLSEANLPVVTASVPQQKSAASGAAYMCTSALYFVATLPPAIDGPAVERLACYRAHPVDLFEGTPHCYPGYLTRDWYPDNVPESLRKLVLRGLVDMLAVQEAAGGKQGSSPGDVQALRQRAHAVAAALRAASKRPFVMPAKRRSKQQEIKEAHKRQAGGGSAEGSQQHRQAASEAEPVVTTAGTAAAPSAAPAPGANRGTGAVLAAAVPIAGMIPASAARPAASPAASAGAIRRSAANGRTAEAPAAGAASAGTAPAGPASGGAASLVGAAEAAVVKAVEAQPAAEAAEAEAAAMESEVARAALSPQAQRPLEQVGSQATRGSRRRQRPAAAVQQVYLMEAFEDLEDSDYVDDGTSSSTASEPDYDPMQEDCEPYKWPVSQRHSRGRSTSQPGRRQGSPAASGAAAGELASAGDAWQAARKSAAAVGGVKVPAEVAASSPAPSAAAATDPGDAAAEATLRGRKRLGTDDQRGRITISNKQYYVGRYATTQAAAEAEDFVALWKLGPTVAEDSKKLNFVLEHYKRGNQLLEAIAACPDYESLKRLAQKHCGATEGSWQAMQLKPAQASAGAAAEPAASSAAAQQAEQGQPAGALAASTLKRAADAAPAASSPPAKRQQVSALGAPVSSGAAAAQDAGQQPAHSTQFGQPAQLVQEHGQHAAQGQEPALAKGDFSGGELKQEQVELKHAPANRHLAAGSLQPAKEEQCQQEELAGSLQRALAAMDAAEAATEMRGADQTTAVMQALELMQVEEALQLTYIDKNTSLPELEQQLQFVVVHELLRGAEPQRMLQRWVRLQVREQP